VRSTLANCRARFLGRELDPGPSDPGPAGRLGTAGEAQGVGTLGRVVDQEARLEAHHVEAAGSAG